MIRYGAGHSAYRRTYQHRAWRLCSTALARRPTEEGLLPYVLLYHGCLTTMAAGRQDIVVPELGLVGNASTETMPESADTHTAHATGI
eukprot:2561651-Rhodomonas_salina.2